MVPTVKGRRHQPELQGVPRRGRPPRLPERRSRLRAQLDLHVQPRQRPQGKQGRRPGRRGPGARRCRRQRGLGRQRLDGSRHHRDSANIRTKPGSYVTFMTSQPIQNAYAKLSLPIWASSYDDPAVTAGPGGTDRRGQAWRWPRCIRVRRRPNYQELSAPLQVAIQEASAGSQSRRALKRPPTVLGVDREGRRAGLRTASPPADDRIELRAAAWPAARLLRRPSRSGRHARVTAPLDQPARLAADAAACRGGHDRRRSAGRSLDTVRLSLHRRQADRHLGRFRRPARTMPRRSVARSSSNALPTTAYFVVVSVGAEMVLGVLAALLLESAIPRAHSCCAR